MSKITPLDPQENMDWMEAFNAVKAIKKQLPTNADYDDLLQSKDYRRFSRDGDYWCLDWILYPESGEPLSAGDQSDSDFSYTLQAKYIPRSAVGKRHIAIRLLPESFEEKDGTTYVIPIKGSVRVQSFPDDDGRHRFDPVTRVPTNTEPKGKGAWDKRYLWRRSSQSLRPLVRWDGALDGWRDVYADWRPASRRGVGWVQPQQKLRTGKFEEKQPEVEECFNTKMPKDGKVVVPKWLKVKVKSGRAIEVTLRTL